MKYHFGRYELDVGARELSSAGEARHVEPQVFDLVQYLVENRERVVDKEELIARVWKGRIVSDATIASRINAARRALGDDGRRQQVIATSARRGFRFVAEVSVSEEGVGQPALAVMPFELLGDGPSRRHLARGLADQLAAALGQAAWFDVRDTAASFAAGLADLSPSEAARVLEVEYLLLGTLQVDGKALRLAVRLADPRSGRQIWSDRFTGPLDEIFAIQDRAAQQVLGEIEPRLRQMELQRSAGRHGDFSAFDHYLRAADILRSMDLPAMLAARSELDRAIERYPGYAAAHGMHAWIATLMIPQGGQADQKREARHYRAALSGGAFDAPALAMGGYALGFLERDPATGLDYVRRALALNPSAARAHDFAGWLLLYKAQPDAARDHFDRALELCPIDEFSFRMLTGRAFAHLFLRQFEAAAADGRRAHATAVHYTVCHRVLAAALAHLGRDAEAGAVVRELRKMHPGLTRARFAKETRFDDFECRRILFDGLQRAGLP